MPQRSIQDSIFWVEVDRIEPNPYQPRKVFEEQALAALAESIRLYGVLQPLTVTRKEIERPGEGIFVRYELIAGERRLRAAKLAGLREVPVVIRTAEDTDRMKLELAIIENLQREDLNPLDRAKAFKRLADEFGLKHGEIGARVGKSREYVSNTLRMLQLPEEMLQALESGAISEGHTRPLLMLIDKPEEQRVLFKEIVDRRLTVRDSEAMARRVAVDKVRHTALLNPDILDLERQLSEKLGTRVRIEKKEDGGKLTIDFFSSDDLTHLIHALARQGAGFQPQQEAQQPSDTFNPAPDAGLGTLEGVQTEGAAEAGTQEAAGEMPRAEDQKKKDDTADNDLYSISNFSV